MSGPTLRQIRNWHRALSAAHTKACRVAEEAEAAMGYDEAVIIMDPICELHAALCYIEGMIEERIALRP